MTLGSVCQMIVYNLEIELLVQDCRVKKVTPEYTL